MKHFVLIFFGLFLLTATFAGCNNDGMYTITGTVTLDGKPVQNGQIDFAPVDNGAGISAGGQILNGKYTVRIKPGKMGVSISASEIVKKEKPTAEEIERGIDKITKETIPEKYNRRSELKQELLPDKTVYDFALTTK